MCVSHWGSPPCTWVQPHGYNLPLLAKFYWHLACFAFTADTLIDFLLVVLLFEHHCTLPLPSYLSSHPTLCLRGWRCRLCLATHSIVALLPLIPWGFIPPPLLFCVTISPLFCPLYLTCLSHHITMCIESLVISPIYCQVFPIMLFFIVIPCPKGKSSPPCWRRKNPIIGNGWKQDRSWCTF